MELYQILLLAFAAIVAGLYIYKRITGINLLQKIALTKPVITAIAAAVEAAYKLWPNDTQKIVHTVLKAGAEAAETAEQAWLMGELEKDERNAYAKKLAHDTLEKAGIIVTAQIDMIINGIIEVVCILLPHGVEPETGTSETAKM